VTDPAAPGPPEFRFGDCIVIVDYNTTARPIGTREFNFRVKHLGHVRVYRVEVDRMLTDHLTAQELAAYLLRCARHKSLLFTYREA
jgi:hypothetical protein